MRQRAALLCLGLLTLPALADERCGSPGGECPVAGGVYRLSLPESAEGPLPALIYLHGCGAGRAAPRAGWT